MFGIFMAYHIVAYSLTTIIVEESREKEHL